MSPATSPLHMDSAVLEYVVASYSAGSPLTSMVSCNIHGWATTTYIFYIKEECISDTVQAGETEFLCLLFFSSKREKLEGKKNEMNGGMEAALLLLQKLKECSSAGQTAPAPPSSCNAD